MLKLWSKMNFSQKLRDGLVWNIAGKSVKHFEQMKFQKNTFAKKTELVSCFSSQYTMSNSQQSKSRLVCIHFVCDQNWLQFSRKNSEITFKLVGSEFTKFQSLSTYFVWLRSFQLNGPQWKVFFAFWEILNLAKRIWGVVFFSKPIVIWETHPYTSRYTIPVFLIVTLKKV